MGKGRGGRRLPSLAPLRGPDFEVLRLEDEPHRVHRVHLTVRTGAPVSVSGQEATEFKMLLFPWPHATAITSYLPGERPHHCTDAVPCSRPDCWHRAALADLLGRSDAVASAVDEIRAGFAVTRDGDHTLLIWHPGIGIYWFTHVADGIFIARMESDHGDGSCLTDSAGVCLKPARDRAHCLFTPPALSTAASGPIAPFLNAKRIERAARELVGAMLGPSSALSWIVRADQFGGTTPVDQLRADGALCISDDPSSGGPRIVLAYNPQREGYVANAREGDALPLVALDGPPDGRCLVCPPTSSSTCPHLTLHALAARVHALGGPRL